ncbi:hypothetical protein LCGC14_2352020 [marine sediment metagenome]|uniref:Uncharacterized protein n=1 Tax=marine sediment metagenome TaxID=412755 RepID=A0A0F9ELN6_9ZZZZ
MAKLFPSKQTIVDQRDGTQILITNVKIVNATSDHLELPNAVDAAFVHAARGTADPTFYLTTSGNELAIDGATVGTEYIVVSRHAGGVNFFRGKNPVGNDNAL